MRRLCVQRDIAVKEKRRRGAWSLIGGTIAGHAGADPFDLLRGEKRRFPDLQAAVILPRKCLDRVRK